MDINDRMAENYFNWMKSKGVIGLSYNYSGYYLDKTNDDVELIIIRFSNNSGNNSSYRLVKTRLLEHMRSDLLDQILGKDEYNV